MKSLFPKCCVAAILAVCPAADQVRAQSHTDTEAVVRTLNQLDERVLRVGVHLATQGAPLCEKPAYASGMLVQLASQYGQPYRAAAARLLGVGRVPTVTVVLPASSAERAGLRRGDQVLSADSRMLTTNIGHVAKGAVFDPADAAMAAIDAALDDGEAMLEIIRGKKKSQIRLVGQPACRSRFDVRAGGSSASANGTYVQLSTDLVQSLGTDTELAAVVAHELAHNILGHPQILETVAGGLLPGFGKSGRVMRATETEADRLSMYLLALAGYSLDDALEFWERFGRAHDYGVLSDRTHPGWRDRITTMRTEAARIFDLRRRGEPIRPAPATLRSEETSEDRPQARPQ